MLKCSIRSVDRKPVNICTLVPVNLTVFPEKSGQTRKTPKDLNRLLDTQEGRQNVDVVFTKESGQHFDVAQINTWVRNHMQKTP